MSRYSTVVAGSILFCVIISSCSSKEKVIGLGENIHHDDFEYSVRSVEQTDQIGNVHARGTFYVVTFRVESRARRVDHRWSNTIAYIVDKSGSKYENNMDVQKELNRINPFDFKNEYVTPAGATETTMLVFDLPREAQAPYLQVRGWLMIGDVFDGNQYKKTKVKLF